MKRYKVTGGTTPNIESSMMKGGGIKKQYQGIMPAPLRLRRTLPVALKTDYGKGRNGSRISCSFHCCTKEYVAYSVWAPDVSSPLDYMKRYMAYSR